MSSPALAQMLDVSKSYRYFDLHRLSLAIEPGQVVGFVGPSGAGKSTTIRLLMGMLTADAGQIHLLGHPMPEAQAAAKLDVGYVSAEMRLLGNASIGWHLKFVSSIYERWDAAYANVLLKRFNLHPEQSVRSLSHGERIRTLLLLTLARKPRLLVLDEPSTGLDPVARHELIAELTEVLRDEERSILLSSHNTVDVERISDRIAFIDRGVLLEDADKEEFIERWRRIELRLPVDVELPQRPEFVSNTSDGQFYTVTTNSYSESMFGALGSHVKRVHRMSLEEIFVELVMVNRRARTS